MKSAYPASEIQAEANRTASDETRETTGVLYIVGTPIGNLEDITLRALRILREVNVIASENPLWTHRLLARYKIRTPMIRYTDAYNRQKRARMAAVLAALQQGDVALVSRAGMPGIADPGYELIRAAIDRGTSVVPIPGPTALMTALAVSGLPAAQFKFLGFVPRKAGARRELIESLASEPYTVVCYESPHRLLLTLGDLQSILGERRIAIACELTKRYEEVWRGSVSEAMTYFQTNRPRGEYTLVIGGFHGDR